MNSKYKHTVTHKLERFHFEDERDAKFFRQNIDKFGIDRAVLKIKSNYKGWKPNRGYTREDLNPNTFRPKTII